MKDMIKILKLLILLEILQYIMRSKNRELHLPVFLSYHERTVKFSFLSPYERYD